MMQNGLTELLADTYRIKVKHFTKVDEGYLSDNQIIGAGNANYFLKKYRFTQEKRIKTIHAVKFFFAEAGIPVILPLKNKHLASFFRFEDYYYSLFPFVTGRRLNRGNLPADALKASAKLLADLHRVGTNAEISSLREHSGAWNRKQFMAEAKRVLQVIEHKRSKDPFDELALETLNLKLALASRNNAQYDDFGLQNDHLIHGDYHEENLFFNENDQVKYVFDFEKTRLAPRTFEVIRSVNFICFSDTGYCPVFDQQSFSNALIYLQTYHAHYPLRKNEFTNACKAYYLGKVHSLWVETEHYLHQNTRTDVFLKPELSFLKYFAKNDEIFIGRINKGLF